MTTKKLDVEKLDNYTIVRCQGLVDASLREETDQIVHPLIESHSARVLIDLSGVDRITSEGLSVFVSLVARANSKGSRIIFAAPKPFVKAVLETTQLIKFLETEETIEQGVERLLQAVPKSNS
jgi:anti-anti-sigma factor